MNLLVAGLLSDVEAISSPDERERDNPSSACARACSRMGHNLQDGKRERDCRLPARLLGYRGSCAAAIA